MDLSLLLGWDRQSHPSRQGPWMKNSWNDDDDDDDGDDDGDACIQRIPEIL